ncbi:MAG: UvrD-helicase domain-containing protein [Eubacteriales bacterium]
MEPTKFDMKYAAVRRAIIEQRFSKLNDKQREAVYQTEGPLLILAGAGSGKTTVLINRIINILKFGDGLDNPLCARLGDRGRSSVPDRIPDRP